MNPTDEHQETTISIPVREGRYQYVRVRTNGDSSTVPVAPADLERGTVDVAVAPGDRVLEVTLSSTSDPDLEPGRGQLWP
jgi:hypothetical protein